MSDGAMIPSSSASFALTLDQNVTREVREHVVALERKAKRAGVAALIGGALTATAAITLSPMTIFSLFYLLPIPAALWLSRRKAHGEARMLDQNRDVACVGPDGLIFFSDGGFFLEKNGGWKPWGVSEPPSRYDRVELREGNRLFLSSSSGYAIAVRVPSAWTELDTARVREKLEAFSP